MLDIKQIALEVAKELLDEPLNIGQAEHYTDFATRFLAAIEPAPQQASRDLQHEHTMNQFKEVCHGRNCKANKAQPTHSNECKADHDNAVDAAPLPDEVPVLGDDVLSEKDALELAIGVREGVLVGRNAHPVEVERLCCFIIKRHGKLLPDEVVQLVEALRRHEWVPVIHQAADMLESLSTERDKLQARANHYEAENGRQAEMLNSVIQQRDELLAALTEIRNLSRTTSAEIYAAAFAAVDRLHASLKELDK